MPVQQTIPYLLSTVFCQLGYSTRCMHDHCAHILHTRCPNIRLFWRCMPLRTSPAPVAASQVATLQTAAALSVLWIMALSSHFTVLPLLGLSHHYVPLLLLTVYLAVLICPFRKFHYRSRLSLLRNLGHIVTLPFGAVGFAEVIFSLATHKLLWSAAVYSSCTQGILHGTRCNETSDKAWKLP